MRRVFQAIIVLLICLIILLIVGFFLKITYNRSTTHSTISTWRKYQNIMYHYSFEYPSNWKLDTSRANLTPDHGFSCPTSSVTVTSPEGYEFTYDNDQCLGDQPDKIVKQENVVIDNVHLVKAWINNNCWSQTSLNSNNQCNMNQFQNIVYDTQDQEYNGYIGYAFKHNNRLIYINFSPSKITSLNDPKFTYFNNILDQITSTIKFDSI